MTDVALLERDVPGYGPNGDLPSPFGQLSLYGSFEELVDVHAEDIAGADLVVLGSYVPDGVLVATSVQRTARGVTAFYDVDTPVTGTFCASVSWMSPVPGGRSTTR